MEIIIRSSNAAKSITEINSAKSNMQSKKSLKAVLMLFGFGLLLFVLGMLTFSSYTKTILLDGPVHYTNWHLVESFGFVLILLSILMFLGQIKQKKKFFKRLNEITARYQASTNEIIIRISDAGVSYQSSELSLEVKWWMFQSYTIHEPYIFLNLQDYHDFSIAVDKRLIQKEEAEELIGFVKKGLLNAR